MSESVVEHVLERLSAEGASEADCVLVTSESLEVRVRGDEIDYVQQAQSCTLGLRAFVAGDAGQSVAITSTSDLSNEEIDRLAVDTVALARATAPDPDAGLPDGGFAADLPDLNLVDPGDRPWKVEDRVEAARSAEAAARNVDSRITNSEGSEAGSQFSEITLGNTRGFLGRYASSSHSLFSAPMAEAGDEKQQDYWYTTGRSLVGLEDPGQVGRVAAERALRKLGGAPVATCEVPIVFEARVASSLLGMLFGCLSGYALYRRSSFLLEKLGESIASARVNVIDDGTLPGRLGSKPFDGEGLPTRRNQIVSEGRLESYLYDAYSGRKLGALPTGTASRGAAGGPGIAPTNLWLEAGSGSLDALIADTPRGLLVTELMGHGFNPVTGDYSQGAGGLWIENGALAQPVQEVTIAGNLGTMLQSIDAIAGDLEWRGRVCAPSLRIERMTVAGSS